MRINLSWLDIINIFVRPTFMFTGSLSYDKSMEITTIEYLSKYWQTKAETNSLFN